MSQLEEARVLVRALEMAHARSGELLEQLRGVLDRAQNGPPDGEGDGTIGEDAYTSLRQLERQATYFGNALEGAGRV